MNLKSIIKSLLVVVFVIVSINAQDALQKAYSAFSSTVNSHEGKTKTVIAVIAIDGKKLIAKTQHEVDVLTSMVDMVKVLKRVKAKKVIDATQYTDKVASLFNYAEVMGIKVN